MRGIKTAWIAPSKHAVQKTQEKAALAWGADPDRGLWYADQVSIYECIDALVEGDQLAVFTADLLAPEPNKRAKETKKDKFREVAELLLGKGVRVHELKTGRTCGNNAELIAMMLDARDVFAGTSGTKAGPGRPRKRAYSAEDLKKIAGLWYHRKHRKNKERLAAVQKEFPEFKIADFYNLRMKLEEL